MENIELIGIQVDLLKFLESTALRTWVLSRDIPKFNRYDTYFDMDTSLKSLELNKLVEIEVVNIGYFVASDIKIRITEKGTSHLNKLNKEDAAEK